jgi:Golgi phosphoprotein 3 (GPP34)
VSLPDELFLLAVHNGRLTRRMETGYVLRAAALVELQLSGHLADEDGRAVACAGGAPTHPLAEAVLAEVAEGKRRRWRHWIQRHTRQATRTVREHLEAHGQIYPERRHVLGIFPGTRVVIPDPLLRERIVSRIAMALRGTHPVDAHDAALVALASAADNPYVMPFRQRWGHRVRVAELAKLTGSVPAALRHAIHARRSSGGG